MTNIATPTPTPVWTVTHEFDTQHLMEVIELCRNGVAVASEAAEAPEDGLYLAETFNAIALVLNMRAELLSYVKTVLDTAPPGSDIATLQSIYSRLRPDLNNRPGEYGGGL